MLHNNYLCLVESNKQQIEEVRSKIQAEYSETRATPKRFWIRPIRKASDGGSISKVGGPKANDQIFFTYNQDRQWRSEKL